MTHPAAARRTELVEIVARAPSEVEIYAIGLLAEETGEVNQLLGKALRFGMDTPGVKDILTGAILPHTPRSLLPKELGDIMAAIDYACFRGVISGSEVAAAREAKLAKLMNPDSRDNMGRRLAP